MHQDHVTCIDAPGLSDNDFIFMERIDIFKHMMRLFKEKYLKIIIKFCKFEKINLSELQPNFDVLTDNVLGISFDVVLRPRCNFRGATAPFCSPDKNP